MLAPAEVTAYAEEMRRIMDGAKERPEQWERWRRRWNPRSNGTRPPVTELCRAYEEATGTRTGCD
jgi:hypothetical protein